MIVGLRKVKRLVVTAMAFGAAGATAALPGPALADSGSIAYYSHTRADDSIPSVLSNADRAYYRDIFAAIHGQQWDTASARLAERDDGPLHAIARAELYLAANSPRVELGPLLALLNQAPDIPQAEQLGRLAQKRGASFLPDMPQVRQLASFASAPRRGKPRAIDDRTMPDDIGQAIIDRIVNDDPSSALTLLQGIESNLSPEALTEWRQRVAWSYYIENQDAPARALALQAGQGRGDWVADAHWVAGLAAWRMNDCAGAGQSFEAGAGQARNVELRAASLYWAARAHLRCRRPDLVEPLLKSASQYDEALYGVLAGEQLGLAPRTAPAEARFSDRDWRTLRDDANVRRALGLMEIGEERLADEVLRHQARIADRGEYVPLLRLAHELCLVQTQIWLAHNAPSGERPPAFARFPSPRWMPARGWRVDPALVYAHGLQESGFRTDARSAADARGVMQLRPGTAQDMARARGETVGADDLYTPAVNLEYGQSYLEELSNRSETQGLLPKVIAAYNAGPTPVGRWNSEVRDQGDPLLFIESIPYYETRAYVGIILRNYWMYERQAGVESQSALGLAQGLWPRFPDHGNIKLVQLSSNGGQ